MSEQRARVESACPNCGDVAARDVYDIGSGPELCCASCEWCWGANGQPLKQLDVEKIVGHAVANARDEWIAELRILANLCERFVSSTRQHDEALSSSLDFVALRARRVADRVEQSSRL